MVSKNFCTKPFAFTVLILKKKKLQTNSNKLGTFVCLHLQPDSDVFDESVTILHNCARNRQLRQYFRDIGAVQLLTPHLARKDKGWPR